MKVSVIQNCHNGEKFLENSLASLVSQTYKDFELIFFDNKSSDSSKKIFDKFKDKRFKYFYSDKKLKLYNARNLAIKESSGDLISFLDTDDWWTKNKLMEQVKSFEQNNLIDVSYTNYFIHNQLIKKNKLNSKKILPSGNITDQIVDDYKIGILTVMLKAKIFFQDNIWFDKNLTILGDFDFFLRLSKYFFFSYIDSPLAFYRNHQGNYSNLNFTEELEEFNYFISKKETKSILNSNQINNLKLSYNINKNKYSMLSNINNKIYEASNKSLSLNKIINLIVLYIKKIILVVTFKYFKKN